MLNLNRIEFTGNITRDPELKYTGGGTAVLNFSVAINDNYKDQQGIWQDRTIFIECTVFGKFAESLNNRIAKGSHVFVDGKLAMDTWQDKNTGQNRSKLYMKADKVQLTQKQQGNSQYGGDDQAPRNEPTHSYQTPQQSHQQPQAAPVPPPPPMTYQNEDDQAIPF